MNQWADLSKMQLNSLIKGVEFYKLQHGSYPDSLQQLVAEHKVVFIYDPQLEVGEGSGDKKINYEKWGRNTLCKSKNLFDIPKINPDKFSSLSHTVLEILTKSLLSIYFCNIKLYSVFFPICHLKNVSLNSRYKARLPSVVHFCTFFFQSG